MPILANRRVQAGQTIRFALPADGPGVEPQLEIPVRVVYEDAFAVVLEKPPHLAVHPTLNYPGTPWPTAMPPGRLPTAKARCSAR